MNEHLAGGLLERLSAILTRSCRAEPLVSLRRTRLPGNRRTLAFGLDMQRHHGRSDEAAAAIIRSELKAQLGSLQMIDTHDAPQRPSPRSRDG
jgi:hypothetical protein